MSPLQYVFGRMLIASAVLTLLLLIGRRAWPRGLHTWAHISFLGCFGIFLPSLLFGLAGARIPSALSAIYNSSVPVLTVLVTLLALRQERISAKKLVAITIGAVGILIVLSPWNVMHSGFDLLGQLFALTAVVCVAFTYAYTRKFVTPLRLDPVGVAASQAIVAALISIPLVFFSDPADLALTPGIIASIFMLGAMSSGVSFVWNFQVIEAWGASSASMVTYLATVTGVFAGVVFLHETLTVQHLVGAVLVLASVAFGINSGRTSPA